MTLMSPFARTRVFNASWFYAALAVYGKETNHSFLLWFGVSFSLACFIVYMLTEDRKESCDCRRIPRR